MANAKIFAYRAARKLGADADDGVRRLDHVVHTDSCNVERAPSLTT